MDRLTEGSVESPDDTDHTGRALTAVRFLGMESPIDRNYSGRKIGRKREKKTCTMVIIGLGDIRDTESPNARADY